MKIMATLFFFVFFLQVQAGLALNRSSILQPLATYPCSSGSCCSSAPGHVSVGGTTYCCNTPMDLNGNTCTCSAPYTPCTITPVPTAAPTTVPWLNKKYYSDNACTNYVGETGLGLNQCFPVYSSSNFCCASGTCPTNCYAIYSWTTSATVLTTTYFVDSACTVSSGRVQTQSLSAAPCQSRLTGNFFYKASLTATAGVPASLPTGGQLVTISPSVTTCGSSAFTMTYIYQTKTFNGCIPYLSGYNSRYASCESEYVQDVQTSNTCAAGTLQQNVLGVCDDSPVTATDQQVVGIVKYSCLGSPTTAPTAVPTGAVAPSTMLQPTVAPTSDANSDKSPNTQRTGMVAGVSVGAAAIACILVALLVYFCCYNKRGATDEVELTRPAANPVHDHI